MKYILQLIRVITGILFFFSGLVKANDPLGLSYKMQEFFEVWHFPGWDHLTLPMAIAMNAFEIIAGFALLLGWQFRLFSWLLFLLIVFFTFLTGYTYFTGLPKNCGCFGDCLPISSLTSFLKDLVLLIFIGLLIARRQQIRSVIPAKAAGFILLLVTAGSLYFQYYTLRHLPVVDCLPFKKGNNILEKRNIPPGSVPDSFAIRFIYTKGGKEYEFSQLDLPADLGTYTFVSRRDKLIRKGNAEAPIKGFDLKGISGADSTLPVLLQPTVLLLIAEKLPEKDTGWKEKFERVYKAAAQKNIPAFIICGKPEEAYRLISGTSFASLPVFTCDNTTIRTAARANPTLYILQQATVKGKWSGADLSAAEQLLTGIPAMPAPVKDSLSIQPVTE